MYPSAVLDVAAKKVILPLLGIEFRSSSQVYCLSYADFISLFLAGCYTCLLNPVVVGSITVTRGVEASCTKMYPEVSGLSR
jgi:hypothetical protein